MDIVKSLCTFRLPGWGGMKRTSEINQWLFRAVYMAKIEILNLWGQVLEVADPERSLLGHFQAAGMDWMHACGAKGRCTTCKVRVVQGLENLGDLTEAEGRYRQRGLLGPAERLACQARITGDVVVEVPAEGMLPHIKYGVADS